MTATELYSALQEELPSIEAFPSDPIGVQVEPPAHTIHHILTCLEVTDAVLAEAVEKRCDCIITFHPLIYTPLSALQAHDRVARCVMTAVVHNIAIVCVHTTLDAHPEGTNSYLAKLLGLEATKPLLPPRQFEHYGLGVIGNLPYPLATCEFARQIAKCLATSVRYCKGKSEHIKRVAIVAGSGSSLLQHAIDSGADAFVTADIKYHTFHQAQDTIALFDPGHFEMEQHVPTILARILQRVIFRHDTTITVTPSTIRTSPIYESSQTDEIESFTTVME